MKNFEKYEKEIKEVGVRNIAVNKNTHEVVDCNGLGCGECLLYDNGKSCKDNITEWLYLEYKEPIDGNECKLCELLVDGWIVRDKSGILYYYLEKPSKNEKLGIWADYRDMNISEMFPQCKFKFIRWEDEEPWEVNVKSKETDMMLKLNDYMKLGFTPQELNLILNFPTHLFSLGVDRGDNKPNVLCLTFCGMKVQGKNSYWKCHDDFGNVHKIPVAGLNVDYFLTEKEAIKRWNSSWKQAKLAESDIK